MTAKPERRNSTQRSCVGTGSITGENFSCLVPKKTIMNIIGEVRKMIALILAEAKIYLVIELSKETQERFVILWLPNTKNTFSISIEFPPFEFWSEADSISTHRKQKWWTVHFISPSATISSCPLT